MTSKFVSGLLKHTLLWAIVIGLVSITYMVAVGQPAGQRSLPWDIWRNPVTTEFAVIQQEAEEWFAGRSKDRGSGYKQWKRWEFSMENRLTPDGHITNYNARNRLAQRELRSGMPQDQLRIHGGFWNQLAPTDGYVLGASGYNPGIGRVNVIAFHPTSSTTVFAGTPGGGLWKTTNEGTSWTCLTDGIPRIGISGIAVHPNDPDIIYILTGDGDGADTFCVGVLRTVDGGTNWRTRGLSFAASTMVRGFKLAMKPGDPATLFAATTQGLYRTDDSGANWTIVLNGSFRDLEFKPGDPETIYACTVGTFWKSESGGDAGTWSSVTTGLPTGENRSALAVSADEPNWVYYLAGPGGPTGSFNGLYRSMDSGDSWSTMSTSPNILDGSLTGNNNCNNGCDQAAYDLAIAVDPDDGGEVITGGINVWRDAANGGASMSIVSHWDWDAAQDNNLEYTHADIHELVFQDNNRLWCGSDGGIFLSTDDGVTWTDKTSAGTDDGLIATQFYRIAGYEPDPNVLIGGTQDNGSNRWSGGNDITHFDGADGMDCMIDYTNHTIQYHCRQNGSLRKSSNAGLTHTSIDPSNSNGSWVTPVCMDPNDNTEIWAGYVDTLYRSTNSGGSWTSIIPNATGESYRRIWCAPSNSNVVYASTNNFIYRSGDNGSTWSNITGTLPVAMPGLALRGITTDVHNSNDVWVVFNGYQAGVKVFYSSNAGSTWTNVSGSLPNVPVNCIMYDSVETNDNAVYIGTDIGVFYRDVTLSDWLPFRNGLPTVEVFDLEVHGNGADKLRAATYGRGIWESTLYFDCPGSWTLTDANLPGNSPQGYRFYQASSWIESSRHFHGGTGTEVYYQAGNYVRLTEGFRAHSVDAFRATNGPCGDGVPEAPLVVDEEALDPDMRNDETRGHGMVDIGFEGAGRLVVRPGKETKMTIGVFNKAGKEIERIATDITLNDVSTLSFAAAEELPPGTYQVIVYGEEVTSSAIPYRVTKRDQER